MAFGVGELIFPLLVVVISVVSLFFSVYKASGVLFNLKTFEMLTSLPFHSSAVVISRFLTMYIQNVGMSVLIMIPVTLIYGMQMGMGILFYLFMILGIFLIPLLPITISTAIGALISAISARMKHKNIVIIVLSLIIVIGLVVGGITLSSSLGVSGEEVVFSQSFIQDVMATFTQKLYAIYPLAKWFSLGVLENNIGMYATFAFVSIAIFGIMVTIVQHSFRSISMSLASHQTSANYKMQQLTSSSVLKALYKKEVKMYFASSVYVVNTIVGYILMVVFAIGLSFMGIEKVEEMLGFSGITNAIPLLMAVICSINSTTAASISMEGKQWWISQSLPISSTQLMYGKLLLNLTIAIPCYLISEAFLLTNISLDFISAIWLLIIPLVYIFFISLVGITMNCKMPTFDWESETAAVKQSGSVLSSMLIGMVSSIVPMIIALLFSNQVNIIMPIVFLCVLGANIYLYIKLKAIDIRSIGA
jgi:ABC-2 type transport system permease protein